MIMGAVHTNDTGPPAANPAIEVENVSFRYRSVQPGRLWTIDEVSFGVASGEVVGIVGPNGSGKSSLLKLIAGLLRPESGAIRVAGRSVRDLTPLDMAKILAVVPQEQSQVFPFTVAETVLMGRFPHRQGGWWNAGIGIERADDLAVAHYAMTETDVVGLAGRLMSDLSGGERQRVIIARALAQDPCILLLDEPTAFLDINHQFEMCMLVQRLTQARSLTVVLVSHDLNVASLLCDRVLMLKDGRLHASGPPTETIRTDVLRSLYGCDVVVDRHPQSGAPRVTLPSINPSP
jgi:iron complex transport system ATP-binding protein